VHPAQTEAQVVERQNKSASSPLGTGQNKKEQK
jgi:hypothetical protein